MPRLPTLLRLWARCEAGAMQSHGFSGRHICAASKRSYRRFGTGLPAGAGASSKGTSSLDFPPTPSVAHALADCGADFADKAPQRTGACLAPQCFFSPFQLIQPLSRRIKSDGRYLPKMEEDIRVSYKCGCLASRHNHSQKIPPLQGREQQEARRVIRDNAPSPKRRCI
jgi:hypothetical protein